jgi:hypothetical protein
VRIGGALTEARSQAGLTVTEVSDRTRIRATIIRDIERDDYSSCGGDYYARGHIRAIARVVGTDPVPLIAEYDAARTPPPDLTDLPPAGHGTDGHVTGGPVRDEGNEVPGPGRLPRPSGPSGRPGGITAAEAFRPSMPLERQRSQISRGTGLLALALLAAVGLLIYLLTAGGGGTAPSGTAPSPHHGRTAAAAAAARHDHTTKPKPKPKPSAVAPAAAPLTPVSAAAFGPGGTARGDNPQLASLAVDHQAGTAWQTDWYSTAHFSGLQSGTGLLLDMGRNVTVTSVTLQFGAAPGGSFELRAGDAPDLASLRVIASAANPGGTVTVPVGGPSPARYLLIWFTSLPPDSAGTYQASIASITVAGQA